MLDYDPVTNLKLYPMPMSRFGQNPYGENLYRIVLGRSRCSLNTNGDGSFSWKPTYTPADDDTWILERWIPVEEFTGGMTREKWDRGFLSDQLGPYPDRGEYVRCEIQLACSPTEANLEKLIGWIEESRKRQMSASGPSENHNALRAAYKAETADNRRVARDIIDNAFSAYLDRAFVSTSASPLAAKRGTKTRPLLHSAQELGLPVRAGQHAIQRRRKVNAVRT